MDEYHLLADFFSTWRSMNDATKNIFIIGFYITVIICFLGRYWLRDWLSYRRDLRCYVMENREALLKERMAGAASKLDAPII